MRRLLPGFILFLTSVLCVWEPAPQLTAQVSSPPNLAPDSSAPPREFLDQWKRSTISLGVVKQDGNTLTFVTLGSAVLVAVDERRGFLVTAKRIIEDPQMRVSASAIWMRLPAFDGVAEAPIPIDLFDQNHRSTWVASEDGNLIALPMPQQVWKHSNLHAMSARDFANSEENLVEGTAAVVVGYPGTVEEDVPIARGGTVTWVNPNTPGEKPFMIDAKMSSGNSGGPAFRFSRSGFERDTNLAGGVAFIGIVYHVAPLTGRSRQGTAAGKNVEGTGIIESAAQVRRLLEKVMGEDIGANPLASK